LQTDKARELIEVSKDAESLLVLIFFKYGSFGFVLKILRAASHYVVPLVMSSGPEKKVQVAINLPVFPFKIN